MRYWLMKSEPSVFSIDDLARAPKQTTSWDGVRNYQARNLLREAAVGDGVIFYHSSADPPAAAGTATIARAAYPDASQFDAKSDHYDPGSKKDEPRWFVVDVKLDKKFARAVPLAELRAMPALEGMVLLRKGSRLSVQPVTPAEWKVICKLGEKS
ncbi:MAG TPA: EVE domain-containing protein [Polyangia bacterium]|jgi:predicted RNA-binding protein with PUA-like domain|nr:EVE domain-containing protein [Polyangia bacterium]